MNKTIGCIIVLLLSYWMIRPMLGAGYFPMHDDTQVARVVEMGTALREGQFPVRWVSNLGYGYGYPIFNFYGPLPYYVGGFFWALGVSGIVATKLMLGLGLILAGVTMYLAVADIVGVSGGILAAAFYMYAPYHAVDAYVRGAVGEYYALIFLPLIFWGFAKKNVLIGAFGIAGLVVSHTILGYAGMVFVTLAYVVTKMRKEVLMFILLGLGLSAFFWLPAITEMKYTNVVSQIRAGADFRDHFVCLPQLWNSVWGFGGSAKGCLDGFPFKVGKVHLIFGLLALFGLMKKRTYVVVAGASVFLLSVFFMLPVSRPVWEAIPLFAYVQYPWRFLAFAIFGISLMAAGLMYMVRNRYVRWVIVAAGISVLLFVEAKRFVPQYSYNPVAGVFETAADIRFRVSKLSDEYLPAEIVRPAGEDEVPRDTIGQSDEYLMEVNWESDTYNKYSFHSKQDSRVRINIAYFPGWRYLVNETYVAPDVTGGLPVISIPKGDTVVQLQFRDTPVRSTGNIISIMSVVVFLTLYDRKNKKTVS
jgi:hypothetical protein